MVDWGTVACGVSCPRVAVVLALVLLAAVTAGCVAVGDEEDEVLGTYERKSGTDEDVYTFHVAEGTERIRLVVSTKESGSRSFDPFQCDEASSSDCYQEQMKDPEGHLEVVIQDPDKQMAGAMRMPFDATDEKVFNKPTPGTWVVGLDYSGYDGPAAIRVTEPAGGASAPLITDNMLEIVGLLLTVGAMVGGWLLYRRRTSFLTRELYKIDHTFSVLSEDVDECRTNLRGLREELKEMLVRRKIDESHYLILEKRIEQYLNDLNTPGNRHAGAAVAGTAERPPEDDGDEWAPIEIEEVEDDDLHGLQRLRDARRG